MRDGERQVWKGKSEFLIISADVLRKLNFAL